MRPTFLLPLLPLLTAASAASTTQQPLSTPTPSSSTDLFASCSCTHALAVIQACVKTTPEGPRPGCALCPAPSNAASCAKCLRSSSRAESDPQNDLYDGFALGFERWERSCESERDLPNSLEKEVLRGESAVCLWDGEGKTCFNVDSEDVEETEVWVVEFDNEGRKVGEGEGVIGKVELDWGLKVEGEGEVVSTTVLMKSTATTTATETVETGAMETGVKEEGVDKEVGVEVTSAKGAEDSKKSEGAETLEFVRRRSLTRRLVTVMMIVALFL